MPNLYRSLRLKHLLFAVLLLLAPLSTAERVEQLNPTNYLNDFARVVDAGTAAQINALCAEVEQKTKAQIAVVTIRSLGGAEAPDFANRLFKKWGVGDKERDRGVLILLAVDDRKYWIEVGYGLEPILPDGKVGGFGREIVPTLREGRYGAALLTLTDRVAETIAADAGVQLTGLQPREQPVTSPPTNNFPWLFFLLFVFFVLLPALSMFGRRSGCAPGCGCLFPFLWGGLGGGGRSRDWGGFGGGSYGGGGFGGFGGGSSGGGGAGGSW
jgi:uncharacterized protein